jgi:hypothetical protein
MEPAGASSGLQPPDQEGCLADGPVPHYLALDALVHLALAPVSLSASSLTGAVHGAWRRVAPWSHDSPSSGLDSEIPTARETSLKNMWP